MLVHGGGAEVTPSEPGLGIEPMFHDGVRVTSPEEMDIVEMILCGRVNKRSCACSTPAACRPWA